VNEDEIQLGVLLSEGPAIIAVKPGVDGVLIEDGILNLQLHLVAEECIAAAAVNNHLAAHAHFLGSHIEADDRFFRAEIHVLDFDAFIHCRPQLVGVLKQHQVELAAIDVIGVFAVDAFLLALVESNVDVRFRINLVLILIFEAALKIHFIGALIFRRPGGAELMRKFGLFHLAEEIEIAKNPHSGRNERLPHVRTRKQLSFKNDAIDARFCQVRGSGAARGSAANDGNIKIRLGENQCIAP